MKTRYKVTKSQLESVVESFVKENKKERINEVDPTTIQVAAGIAGLVATAGGTAALEMYIDKLGKTNPDHKLVKMLKQLRELGKIAGKARRGESVEGSNRGRVDEVAGLAIAGGIAALVATAGGSAALEMYIDKLEKTNPDHKLVKMLKQLRELAKAAASARR